MRRVIALLLIPMCLFGQGMPHSHAGTGVCEPEGHAARPHVHLHCGHDHDEVVAAHDHHHADAANHDHLQVRVTSERTNAPAFAPIADHDADAFYLGNVVPSVGCKQTVNSRNEGQWFASDTGNQGFFASLVPGRGEFSGVAPPGFVTELPILLRTASLRI
jgi:hypothetical protein